MQVRAKAALLRAIRRYDETRQTRHRNKGVKTQDAAPEPLLPENFDVGKHLESTFRAWHVVTITIRKTSSQ